MTAYISLYMFATVCLLLMLGYPVAFTLAGTALAFAAGASWRGISTPASWPPCPDAYSAPSAIPP